MFGIETKRIFKRILDIKFWKEYSGALGIFMVVEKLIMNFYKFLKSIHIDIKKIDFIKCIIEIYKSFYYIVPIIIFIWILCITLKKFRKFFIGAIKIEIKVGNIFDEKDLKIIPFNEYFDTTINDKIISKNSLNGKFINDIVKNIEDLDILIEKDVYLKKIKFRNENRREGKHYRYPLGIIVKYDDYLLTAFSKFDDKNQAYLELKDYYLFLENFWKEISRNYANNNIVIPLLGSGITRLKVTDTELLKMLLLTFKLHNEANSRCQINLKKLTIILTEDKLKTIDLYHLKELIGG